jgi:hypothetical protein
MSANYIKWTDVEAILTRLETIVGHAASLNCRGCARMRQLVHSEIESVRARHRLIAVDPEDSVHHQRLIRKKESGFY